MSLSSHYLRLFFAPSVLSLAVSSVAHAQNETDKEIEEVVVRAHPLSAEGLAQPVSVLDGDSLQRALSASLGETLQGIPGVTFSSFGQAVGRPVIRGLAGPRVKTMEDRIDSLDVATSSPDHATTIDPFVAQSVEVLKGPSTLLYGSGAIGGVVDVHSGRILHAVPETLTGGVEVRGADNANQRGAAGRLDGGAGNFALHLDGFYRDADEYDIPGYAESSRYRAQEEEHEHEEEHDHEEDHADGEDEVFGTLPGSQFETRGGAIGASYIGERSFFGVAVSSFQAEYGLPGHSHAHHEEEEDHADEHQDEHEEEHAHSEGEMPPILDLEQTRIDLEGGIDSPFAGVRSINFRMGYNDYEHVEIEGDEVGTLFSREAWEGRLELRHEPILGFEGAAGVQLGDSEFSVVGEEAYVQPVDTQTFGVFWVGQQNFGSLGLEAGVRIDSVEHDPAEAQSRGRDFTTGSVSLGLIQPLSDRLKISGQLDYSSRAPVAEELYSFGPHLATQSYELGDENLEEETATNISVALQYEGDSWSLAVSAYITEFGDFIYQSNTGLEEDELPVYQWTQGDATFMGVEGEASWQAITWSAGGLTLTGGFDAVDGELARGGDRDLPRIPASRWWLGAMASWDALNADITWRTVADQDVVAPYELQTDGYNDLRAHVGYRFNVKGSELELFLNGRNLTDDEQRLHTSFVGQFAPLPGRTLEAGVRLEL